MRIEEIMTTDVETIQADASADVASEQMRAGGIHHLVVVRGKSIAGILSSRDVDLRPASDRKARSVGEVMTPDPACVESRTLVRRAANVLRGRSIGCLPVVDSGRLVGIVTISDVLELVGRGAGRGPSGRVDHAPLRRAATDLRRVHVPGSRSR